MGEGEREWAGTFLFFLLCGSILLGNMYGIYVSFFLLIVGIWWWRLSQWHSVKSEMMAATNVFCEHFQGVGMPGNNSTDKFGRRW